VCALLFYDRFVSLIQGEEDHEVILELDPNSFMNGCITNITTPDLKEKVTNEFNKISKISDFLDNIVCHSQRSSDNNIKELENIVPDGVHLEIVKVFPQNTLTMYNVVGNPPSRHGSFQKGLVVYSKETTTPELNLKLTQCKDKTDVKELGVMLFYPDGDDAVKLFPNPDWTHNTDNGVHGSKDMSLSEIGIGGKANA
jgi:hypothetical protein